MIMVTPCTNIFPSDSESDDFTSLFGLQSTSEVQTCCSPQVWVKYTEVVGTRKVTKGFGLTLVGRGLYNHRSPSTIVGKPYRFSELVVRLPLCGQKS